MPDEHGHEILTYLDKIFNHLYLISFYGVIMYYFALLALEKRRATTRRKPFDFKKWRQMNGISFWFTMAVAPLTIVFDDEIISLWNNFSEFDIEGGFSGIVYVSAGPLVDLVVFRWIFKIRSQRTPPPP